MPLVPVVIPTTLEETVPALNALLSKKDRRFIKRSTNHYKTAVQLHHTLGRHLRNEWGLWQDSPLARYFKQQGIEHPDDMSHAILMYYSRSWIPTRWQRIASGKDEL